MVVPSPPVLVKAAEDEKNPYKRTVAVIPSSQLVVIEIGAEPALTAPLARLKFTVDGDAATVSVFNASACVCAELRRPRCTTCATLLLAAPNRASRQSSRRI